MTFTYDPEVKFYKTRDGEKWEVFRSQDGTLIGYQFDGGGDRAFRHWTSTGSYYLSQTSRNDLVGPWTEIIEGAPEPPATEGESQGRCETTLTERFALRCVCKTYSGNLGPCKSWLEGANGRCAYCDHSSACHIPTGTPEPPASPALKDGWIIETGGSEDIFTEDNDEAERWRAGGVTVTAIGWRKKP